MWFVLPLAAAITAEGEAYLKEHAARSDVTVTASGLQYRVLEAGKPDGLRPNASSPCQVHYAGRLVDGTEFDSSYKRGRPATFAPQQVIKGWTEAMQLMREGDKWELVIPPALGYGDRGAGGTIPGGAVLIFE